LTGLVRALLLANWRADDRLAIGVLVGLVVAAGAIYAAWGPIVAALAAAILVVAPYKVVQAIGQRNVRRFNAHLPSFIERLRMFLTSGSSLVTAFDKALDHSDRMVQAFLRPVAVRLSHGINLAEALRAQGNRLGIPEISMLAMVAHANLRFGGSLADILDRLSDVVRGRLQAQSEFDAATSEVRSSSKVLFLLPVLVVGAIFAVKPDYLDFFVHQELGHYLLGYAAGSAVVGALVLNRLQKIRY
jgi:tight adherence protein B